jgi:predicted DNA-binding ribbon-helix-helix protein
LAIEHTDLDSILRVACLAWLQGDAAALIELPDQ